jgi:hypothetical protein
MMSPRNRFTRICECIARKTRVLADRVPVVDRYETRMSFRLFNLFAS